jgi:hypothetical protein
MTCRVNWFARGMSREDSAGRRRRVSIGVYRRSRMPGTRRRSGTSVAFVVNSSRSRRPTREANRCQLPPVTSMEPWPTRMPTACLVKPVTAWVDFLGPTWDSPIGASVFNLRPRAGPGEPVGHKVGHTDVLGGLEL